MRITIRPFGQVLNVLQGTDLRSALEAAGIHLRSDCGGKGRCGKCRVRGRDHLTPPTPQEKKLLGARELRKGMRLACQARVRESLEVFIPPTSMESRLRILVEGVPKALKLQPAVQRHVLPISPEKFVKDLSWEAVSPATSVPKKAGPAPTLHLLQHLPAPGDGGGTGASLISLGDKCIDLIKGEAAGQILGLALDVGTTTIVGYLLDLLTGTQLSVAARKNPQAKYGADVVSRIVYATTDPHGLKRLQEAVIKAINEIIQEATQKAGVAGKQVYEICAVGNTTMHHLLLGLSPFNLTHFPYTPVIRQAFAAPAQALGIAIHPEGQVYLPPLIAGYMGSDTVGVVLATRLHRSKSIKLAIDFGTNGEVVLGNRSRLVAASCAAGPAFEGSQIRYGMTGSSGAIDSVALDGEGRIRLHTIDDYPPVGICGSGLVDAVAVIRRLRIIDGSGRLLSKKEVDHPGLARRLIKLDGQGAFLLCPVESRSSAKRIYITQKDIRELQLAKGALRAGIQILMKELRVSYQEIAEVLLAGAFGNYVKPESAMGIGLLPGFERTRIKPVGNAAGTGAQRALLSLKERAEADTLAQKIEYIELAKHPDFQKEFIEGMAFPP